MFPLNSIVAARLSRSLPALVCAVSVSTAGASGGAEQSADQKECAPSSTPTQLASETASAGLIANATNRSDSIRAVSHRLLTSAIETAEAKEPRQTVLFTSTPELSKETTSDDQMCAQHEQETKERPIEFNDKSFASTEDLTKWIMDFTQGKGSDGKVLYEQCPGKCSPQYKWRIEPQASSELKVQARVVCGMPRDRDSNQYTLVTALAPACAAK